jgi:hypothetical protein
MIVMLGIWNEFEPGMSDCRIPIFDAFVLQVIANKMLKAKNRQYKIDYFVDSYVF